MISSFVAVHYKNNTPRGGRQSSMLYTPWGGRDGIQIGIGTGE